MCIIFMLFSGFLAVSFYSNGDMIFASMSGVVCAVLLVFFMRNMINNAPCLFGNRNDCNK